MKQRIITAFVLALILVPCVLIGGIAFDILAFFVALGMSYELIKICEPKAKLYMYVISALFIVYGLFFEKGLMISNEFSIILAVVLLCAHIFDASTTFSRTAYYFLTIFIVSMGLHMIYQLRTVYGFNYIMMMVFATFGCDTGAYFVGVTIGKHKLCPRLSPKKSIEGSVGGIITGTILAVLFAYFIGINMSVMNMILVSFVLTITGQIGDLTFSSMKRMFDVKDFSNLLPGHGGLLDRFDSLLFNSMIFGLLLSLLKVVA